MDKLYTIQEVATKLNLSDKTLRRWEEAGRFTPSRTLGNQRRYTIEDLQILDAIKHNTISEQKDLLTIEQAGKLCGVSPTTILRWENDGKIHPFITSGNTYYPRQKLIEKMEELKKIYVEPIPKGPDLPAQAGPEGSVQTRGIPVLSSSRAESRDLGTPKLTPLLTKQNSSEPRKASLPAQAGVSNFGISTYLTNAAVTLVLILSYHLIFNQPSAPVSPQGAVQGASTSVATDPRVDDLITKFQDYVSTQMLKDAKPSPNSTLKLDNASLVSGSSTLPKNKDQVSVTLPAQAGADKITPTTPVTVTFTSDYAPAKKYWVTPGEGSFTVTTDFPVSTDSTFNYSFLAPTSTPSAVIR